MKVFLNKLTSRKFLTCVAGIVLGICMMFGVDQNAVSTVAGAFTSLVSACMYMYVEGKIDAAAVKDAQDAVYEIVEVVDDEEE